MSRNRMAVTPAKARKVYEAFCALMGEDGHDQMYVTQGCDRPLWDRGGPMLVRDLEDRGTFGIAWEGGLDCISRDFWHDIERRVPGIFIESGGSWYVTIWPA